MYRGALRVWMKDLWYFTREYNKRKNLEPFPSYICVSFANPEMTRRIHEQHDLAVRVIGRCVEALVVSKLAADINSRRVPSNSRRVPVRTNELACLSAILGTKSRDVVQLLRNPGAIEFTKMIFLALDNFYSFTHETVPPDSNIPFVVHKTFRILNRALPDSDFMIPLDQRNTQTNVVDGQCELVL